MSTLRALAAVGILGSSIAAMPALATTIVAELKGTFASDATKSVVYKYYYHPRAVVLDCPHNDLCIESARITRVSGQIGDTIVPFHQVDDSFIYNVYGNPDFFGFRLPSDIYPYVEGSISDVTVSFTYLPSMPITINNYGGASFNVYPAGSCCGSSSQYVEFSSMTLSVSDIPEPTTWLLLLAGFGAIGAAIRQRRAKVRVAYA